MTTCHHVVRLYQGDCLKVLPTLTDKSVDLVLCDLPYGITQNRWDSILPMPLLWEQYGRICKGAVVLFTQQPFTSLVTQSNLKNFRHEVIWEKNHGTGFLNAKIAPLKVHENILIFKGGGYTHNAQMSTGHKMYRTTPMAGNVRSGKNYGYLKHGTGSSGDTTLRYPQSVIHFSKVFHPKHPTQKPLDLLQYLIRTYSNPGDVVLDNCMGSGSAGVAAANECRSFSGIEIDDTYYKLARSNILHAYHKHKTWRAGRVSFSERIFI